MVDNGPNERLWYASFVFARALPRASCIPAAAATRDHIPIVFAHRVTKLLYATTAVPTSGALGSGLPIIEDIAASRALGLIGVGTSVTGGGTTLDLCCYISTESIQVRDPRFESGNHAISLSGHSPLPKCRIDDLLAHVLLP